MIPFALPSRNARPRRHRRQSEGDHFATVVRLHRAGRDLAVQRSVGAEEELLPGLAASVESTGDLRAAEGAVVEQPAVVASERNALRDALVDDRGADFGQAVNVGFASAEVAALDRVVEQTINGVVVVLVVLRGVDTALRGDGVSAARAVGDAEHLHVEAQFAERRGGGSSAEAGADDDDFQFAFVRRADDFSFGLETRPFFGQGTGRDFRLQSGFGHVLNLYSCDVLRTTVDAVTLGVVLYSERGNRAKRYLP